MPAAGRCEHPDRTTAYRIAPRNNSLAVASGRGKESQGCSMPAFEAFDPNTYNSMSFGLSFTRKRGTLRKATPPIGETPIPGLLSTRKPNW